MWRKKTPEQGLSLDRIPRHVAIIMDGNGRWAQKRGMPRTVGHRAGLDSARAIIEDAANLGVKYLTLYMFSTENWKRPQEEVDFLMSLPEEFWRKEKDNLAKYDIRLRVVGDMSPLPVATREVLLEAIVATQHRTGMTVNLAINYGGRADILQAARALCQSTDAPSLDEAGFSRLLYTLEMPDPDLLIRPGGEMRLSNYLLWQLAYAELYFTPILWPDFGVKEFRDALLEFQNRERRRGGL